MELRQGRIYWLPLGVYLDVLSLAEFPEHLWENADRLREFHCLQDSVMFLWQDPRVAWYDVDPLTQAEYGIFGGRGSNPR